MAGQRRGLNILAIAVAVSFVAAVVWFLVSQLDDGDDAVRRTEAATPEHDPADEPRAEREPGELRGIVVEAPDETPVANALVTVSTTDGEVETTTDADGAFSVRVSDTTGLVYAEAPGLRNGGRNDDGLRVSVPAGQTLSGVKVTLYEPCVLMGRVRFHGRPADARVIAWYERDRSGAINYEAEVVETDPEGRFRLIGLAPGRLRVRVEASGAAPRESALVDLYSGDIVDIGTIDLRAGGSIVGRVRAADDSPIMGARVEATTLDTRAPSVAVRTNEHGVFALYGVAAGLVDVTVEAPGHRADVARLALEAEQELVHEVSLDVLNGIVVRVVDPAGLPIDGANVVVYDLGAEDPSVPILTRSEVDAPLYLSDLIGGPFRVEADAMGQQTEAIVYVGGTADLVLAGELRLGGVVLRADGSFARGAQLRLVRHEDDGSRQGVRVDVAEDGRFDFPDLMPGIYTIIGSDEGHRETESDRVELSGGAVSMTLRLAMGGVFAGRVYDEVTGAPIAGARVGFEGDRRNVQSGVDGTFRVAAFPQGRTSIRVSAPGYRSTLVSALEVGDGQVFNQDIAMTPLAEGEQEGDELEMVGIGIQVGFDNGALVVTQPMDGSAGFRAGLEPGDRVLSIDGKLTGELGFKESVERIRGEVGTAVRLRVARGDRPPFEVTIERERVVYERNGQ